MKRLELPAEISPNSRKIAANCESQASAPGLPDLWQLHYAVAAGKDHNSPDPFIANVNELCEGKWIRATVRKDGGFTVYNSRDKYEKTYTKN